MWWKTCEYKLEYTDYPKAQDQTSGLSIGETIPNTGSIDSSLVDYEILPGIREIPLSEFASSPKELFYAADDIAWAKSLAEKIKASGYIDPLIVVIDKEGPYILEGAHRLGALHLLGMQTFPAKVVLDLEDCKTE